MNHKNDRNSDFNRARDTGQAMVLIFLLLMLGTANHWLLYITIALQIATMARPQLFAPLRGPWFGLSHALGTTISSVLLSTIFLLVVTPVAILRRLSGADSLKLSNWQRGHSSAFTEKQQKFCAHDLEYPY